MHIAERLDEQIKARGITYTFVSNQTGIPVDALSKSFKGKRRLSAEEMVSICDVIGIDISDFINTHTSA